MTPGNPPDNASEQLEYELERLLSSAAGSVIYDQLARVVVEWQEVELEVQRSYRNLLRLLVEEFAADPSSDRVLILSARLIQARHRSGAPVVPMTPGLRHADLVAKLAPDAGLRAVLAVLAERLSGKPAQPQPQFQSAPTPAPAPAPAPTMAPSMASASVPCNVTGSVPASGVEPAAMPAESDVAQPATEQRVNTAYRQHLDRQREEISKLQATLAQKVNDALTQSHEFSELLQMGRNALNQAESVHEVTTLRQILLGGIDDLLQGQRQLTRNLSSSHEVLQVIETDSARLQDELHKVRLLNQSDDSTGLPNRRAFARRLEDEMTRASRYGTTLTLAILELDEYPPAGSGRITADRVLRCYAEQVLSIFRHHDVVARYGTEQFAVLLPTTTLDGARAALHKVQNRAAMAMCEYEGQRLPLPTVSCGLALYRTGDTATMLLERAQRALVRARHLGPGRIEADPSDQARRSLNGTATDKPAGTELP